MVELRAQYEKAKETLRAAEREHVAALERAFSASGGTDGGCVGMGVGGWVGGCTNVGGWHRGSVGGPLLNT